MFELRDVGTGVRLFYMFLPGTTAVLLDGMTKKRDDIPASMRTRLRGFQRSVEAEKKKKNEQKKNEKRKTTKKEGR